MRRSRYALLGVAMLAIGWAACDEKETTSGTGGSSEGGGGCAPVAPAALFVVTIAADPGPLPSDTAVRVKWSAGDEPEFILGDETTHKTLEDGSNLVCRSEEGTITCDLWTVGATEIDVTATGYLAYSETLLPEMDDLCEVPVPSEREILLEEDRGQGGR